MRSSFCFAIATLFFAAPSVCASEDAVGASEDASSTVRRGGGARCSTVVTTGLTEPQPGVVGSLGTQVLQPGGYGYRHACKYGYHTARQTLLAQRTGKGEGAETQGMPAQEAIPSCCHANIMELASKLDSSDRQLRWDALSKIGLYGAEAGSAVPRLIQHLSVKEDQFRTIHTLGSIGPPAKTAVPELVSALAEALKNTDKYSSESTLAIEIIQTLSKVRERKDLIVPVLRRSLVHPYANIRYEGAHALGDMGSAGRVAIADLKKLSTDQARPSLYTFPHGGTVGEAAQDAIEHINTQR